MLSNPKKKKYYNCCTRILEDSVNCATAVDDKVFLILTIIAWLTSLMKMIRNRIQYTGNTKFVTERK